MVLKVLVGLLGTLALMAAGVLIVHWNRPRVLVSGPPTDAPRVALRDLDHARFDALLQQYVNEQGLVAYRRWKSSATDVEVLDRYLADLGSVDLSQDASRAVQLAYWINAYNALTLKGILREYPTSSIRNHTAPVGGYNLWKDLLLPIDAKPYSLDAIEHDVLRGRFREPRIHFALVCASKGCPPLRRGAYTGARIEEQLDDNARIFFARPDNFRADAARRTVHVSELFDWYGSDFAPTPIEQLRVLRRYLPSTDQLSWLDGPNVSVHYLEYDWGLNDQEPMAR